MANDSASWAPVYPSTAGCRVPLSCTVHRHAFCPVGMLLLWPWPSEVCVAISLGPPRKDEGNGTHICLSLLLPAPNEEMVHRRNSVPRAREPSPLGSEAASVGGLVPSWASVLQVENLTKTG